MQRSVASRLVTARPRIRAADLIPVALGLTVVAFLPVLGNGFVEATESHHGHFVPLAWLTLALDYVVWGMNPAGYHLSNLGIHATATGVLYLVTRTLIARGAVVTPGAATAGAAAAALLFGLHPLRVESVAWATARRDVLSGLFFLLTVLAYVRSTAATGARRRWLLAGSVGGEQERASVELDVLRRLHPGLASRVVADGGRS